METVIKGINGSIVNDYPRMCSENIVYHYIKNIFDNLYPDSEPPDEYQRFVVRCTSFRRLKNNRWQSVVRTSLDKTRYYLDYDGEDEVKMRIVSHELLGLKEEAK